MAWADVRTNAGRLLFRLDARRALLEIKAGHELQVVDLQVFGLSYVGHTATEEPMAEAEAPRVQGNTI
jgi:hypothetical protein